MMVPPSSREKTFTTREQPHPDSAGADDETKARAAMAKANAELMFSQQYQPGKREDITGLIIAAISLGKGHKTTFAWQWAYANLKYENLGLPPAVAKCIRQGKLPEIENVAGVDTEETMKRDLDHGYLGDIMAPVVQNTKIHIESVPLLRAREKMKGGVIVKYEKEYDADKMRDNFEAAIWAAAERFKGNTLLIVDSMSDYRDMITDEQDTMGGKTVIKKYGRKSDEEDTDETNTDRRFYRYRNKWWTNILMKLRSTSCWVVETFKLEVREPEWQWKDVRVRTGKDKKTDFVYESIKLPETYPVMVGKTDYRIDQGYTLRQIMDMKTQTMKDYVRTDWYRHPHSTIQYLKLPQDQREAMESKCLLEFPQFDRMAAMYLIEDMAPSILQESGKTTWGKYGNAK